MLEGNIVALVPHLQPLAIRIYTIGASALTLGQGHLALNGFCTIGRRFDGQSCSRSPHLQAAAGGR